MMFLGQNFIFFRENEMIKKAYVKLVFGTDVASYNVFLKENLWRT